MQFQANSGVWVELGDDDERPLRIEMCFLYVVVVLFCASVRHTGTGIETWVFYRRVFFSISKKIVGAGLFWLVNFYTSFISIYLDF